MISKETFEAIKAKYGLIASWAVWRPASKKSNTTNIFNMSWTEDENLLDVLNPNYVFVGLNGSSTHGDQLHGGTNYWNNFHSSYSRQQDYKLRHAITGTPCWGAYMTDIIKNFPEVDSVKVKDYIKANPDFVRKNIEIFEDEIRLLGTKPILIALGGDSFKILSNYLGNKYDIRKIRHYASSLRLDDYREELLSVLGCNE